MPNELNANAQKWVDALRSGKYTQGRKALHEDNEFCCLGVACDLYSKEVSGTWVKEPDGSTGFYFMVNGYSSQDNLPMPVGEWLGLNTNDGFLIPDSSPGVAQSLIELNDNFRFDFKKIADVIESQPEGLFNA